MHSGSRYTDPQYMKWRLTTEGRAFARAFRFTKRNSTQEKILLWALLAVWVVITIGVAFGYAEATTTYNAVTALVWALLGRVWGIELHEVTADE